MNSPKISIEKQSSKSKYKILRLIPKAAQASVSFQNPPFSPSRDKRAEGASQKLKSRLKKTFSGPIMYMIPAEAREKTKNFETHEPTSPKVSCMGQIKHKNKICRQKKQVCLPKESKPVLHSRPEKLSKARSAAGDELKKKPSGIKKILSGRRKSDASINHGKPPLPDRAPSISQMRRFASSRDALADFDWTTAQIESGRAYSDEESDGEDEAFIPFSAPILMSGVLEPRKEVNLWRRRTMAQPKPLQLNIVRAQ